MDGADADIVTSISSVMNVRSMWRYLLSLPRVESFTLDFSYFGVMSTTTRASSDSMFLPLISMQRTGSMQLSK